MQKFCMWTSISAQRRLQTFDEWREEKRGTGEQISCQFTAQTPAGRAHH